MSEQKNEAIETNLFSRLLDLYNAPGIQKAISLAFSGMYFAGTMSRTMSDSKTVDTLLSGLTTPFAILGAFHLGQSNIISSVANKCNLTIHDISNKLLRLEQYLHDPKISEHIANAERVTLIISNLLQLIANYEQYNKVSRTEQSTTFNNLQMAGMTIYLIATTINHLYSLGVFKKLASLPFYIGEKQNLTKPTATNQEDPPVIQIEIEIVKNMDKNQASIQQALKELDALNSLPKDKSPPVIFSQKNPRIKSEVKRKKRRK